jgi:tRNA dimethylallyltransferase
MKTSLIICGPTATGKTKLAVKLAKLLEGEIVSADSRQAYKGMDIGTGKDIDQNSEIKKQTSIIQLKNSEIEIGFREKEGIPVWLVDMVKPDYNFNVSDYTKCARIVVEDISSRGKLPIIVGGTGLYIKALLETLDLIGIGQNNLLRKKIEKQTVEKLQKYLLESDATRFEKMNQSDQKNPRRLIRAIEIAEFMKHNHRLKKELPVISDSLNIGLTAPIDQLKKNIEMRVHQRMQDGLVEEVTQLINAGYDWSLSSMSATGYQVWRKYFEEKKPLETIIKDIIQIEFQYAKRQLTWFKKMKNIRWFDVSTVGHQEKIVKYIKA